MEQRNTKIKSKKTGDFIKQNETILIEMSICQS